MREVARILGFHRQIVEVEFHIRSIGDHAGVQPVAEMLLLRRVVARIAARPPNIVPVVKGDARHPALVNRRGHIYAVVVRDRGVKCRRPGLCGHVEAIDQHIRAAGFEEILIPCFDGVCSADHPAESAPRHERSQPRTVAPQVVNVCRGEFSLTGDIGDPDHLGFYIRLRHPVHEYCDIVDPRPGVIARRIVVYHDVHRLGR